MATNDGATPTGVAPPLSWREAALWSAAARRSFLSFERLAAEVAPGHTRGMEQERDDYRDWPEPTSGNSLSAPLFLLAVSPLALILLAALGLVAGVYLGVIGE